MRPNGSGYPPQSRRHPREAGQIYATWDLRAGLASLLEKGPRQATFEGR